jgi:hypothetical protein
MNPPKYATPVVSGAVAQAAEEMRARCRPVQTSLLFVGESVPAGGKFFFDGNNSMYQYRAFKEAIGLKLGNPPDVLHQQQRLYRPCTQSLTDTA